MQPARASNSGQVLLCCCIPKGTVTLTSTHDKAAYQSGETALCQAIINNESTSNINRMVSKLTRTIQIMDGKGASRSWYDVMAVATFPGVPEKSTATRDMPLKLSSSSGPLLPSISSPFLNISYKFEAECDIPWAPDIEAHLPLVIYAPSPPVYGVAAFASQLPPAVAAYVQANPMPAPAMATMGVHPTGAM
jgi:Arrestin (or S-antigen), C-terminal domain